MLVGLMAVACVLVVIYNLTKDGGDPNANKMIKNGYLVATKDFVAKGRRQIKKGTKGGKIHPKALLDLTDTTWIESDCVVGIGADIYNSYLKGCDIENWHIIDSECFDCEIKARHSTHWTVEATLRGKVWDKDAGVIRNK